MNKRASNVITLLLICSSLTPLFAQDRELKLKSLSIGAGFMGSSSETSIGGFAVSLDLSMMLDKHVFSLYLSDGSELDLVDAEEKYTELNLTYGRPINLNPWIKLEWHVGLGHFRYSYKSNVTDFVSNKESTIGVPIRAKLIFYTGRHFGIGINSNVNLNALVNTYSGNICLQYEF
ncbi:hypothetical protein FGF1_28980 [Flavobacteriaceae bacterium GF1]